MKEERDENNNTEDRIDENHNQSDDNDVIEKNAPEPEELILPSVRRMATLFQEDQNSDKSLRGRRHDPGEVLHRQYQLYHHSNISLPEQW